ncbi:eukaryotic translation initiation factor 2A-like [Acropora millepora]|uniref:eukaryotic translation initiation factor 2A-like n=1 Tax=Acropora millepora TaxID=45264 RepID=UPI001CF37167|nr:eukaryotic translation initiation factor 2A-like [Acropora millepora]
MAAISPLVAIRGSEGISMINGPPSFKYHEQFRSDNSSRCRVMAFSPDGSLFAWCNGQSVLVVETGQYNLVCRLPKDKTVHMAFSPKGTHLSTWEQYSANKDQPSPTTNLEIWNLKAARLVAGFSQKKKDTWKPKWSDDETVCARAVTNEVHCYHDADFTSIAAKLRLEGVSEFELSPGPPPLTVAAYVPGAKGAPSFVRLFRHPNFGSPLANKSFFKADRVTLLWNKTGTAVLILTSTDVDKSGASYYGEQTLQFVSTSGDSSMVQLGKRGPIYSVQWSPNSKEFCVVYGFMPAKATLYNIKCDPVFDFGTGPRNDVFYNPHGNIICLAGFGNLRGQLELWSRKDFKLISKPQASDSTSFEWSPDGEHILTATTSPRLKEGNGYKIWHYTGKLIHEKSVGELWEVKWQPLSCDVFKEPVISCEAVSATALQDQQKEASKQVYRPPGLRGTASVKLHEFEPAENMKKEEASGMSKSAQRRKKKKDAKERAKQEAIAEVVTPALCSPPQTKEVTSSSQPTDKQKKLKNLRKKLRQIQDLKEQQASGKTLEKGQIDKISGEASLIQEIQQLELSS